MFRHALHLVLSLILAIEAHAAEDSAKPEVRWQRVELGSAPSTYPFALYSSKALDGDAGRIVQAIVVLHGLQRNGDDYYRAAYKLLMSSGAEPESTLLIAPNFLASADAAKFDLTGIPIWSTQGWGLPVRTRSTGHLRSAHSMYWTTSWPVSPSVSAFLH